MTKYKESSEYESKEHYSKSTGRSGARSEPKPCYSFPAPTMAAMKVEGPSHPMKNEYQEAGVRRFHDASYHK